MNRPPVCFALLALVPLLPLAAQPAKQQSVFYPPRVIHVAEANAAQYPWAAHIRDRAVAAAEPWKKLTDDQLWDLMLSPSIERSHQVWSSGFCPRCKKPVPMYNWKIDALHDPWKVQCPYCQQRFPTNDFERYYRSGLNEHSVFVAARADRSLLFNAEHPDPKDPLHLFGVDDGEGYVEGDHRWHFIGGYALYGEWDQLVLGGISNLAQAYTITGDPVYAHKAAVLLDRVADLFPDFDYKTQGLVYEIHSSYGYVSYAIQSASDVRTMTLAYDQIFDAARNDRDLLAFLARKARECKLENSKASFADVQRNVEGRILRDVLAHPQKIRTNYPGNAGGLALIQTVLGWPGNRTEVVAALDDIVAKSTAVDGLSGEKGLDVYATLAPDYLSHMLEQYARIDPDLLSQMLERHPKLRQTYRFFVDTWCSRLFYPNVGDSGSFGTRATRYAAIRYSGVRSGRDSSNSSRNAPVSATSPLMFLWRMYHATQDPMYLQIAYNLNGNRSEGIPNDIFAENTEGIRQEVEAVVAREGAFPKVRSVNEREYHVGILRSPRDPDAGAVWMAYDSIPTSELKSHYHFNAMNVGLYWKGLDLLPEFGYPFVQFTGWGGPKFEWNHMTAAHNTVVVDGENQAGGDTKTTLWADGPLFHAMRASSPAQIHGKQYERSLAMVNTDDSHFYVVDVFRVVGGSDQARMMHSYFGTATPQGLSLGPAPDFGHGTQMRNFREDPRPKPGWSVDWKIDDPEHYVPENSDVHLRYTDLTAGAQAWLCDSWTVKSINSTEDSWVPTVMTRRQTSGTAPLSTAFVGVIEPYESHSQIASIHRLRLTAPNGSVYPDADAAVEIRFQDGARDVVIAADAENPLGLTPSLTRDHVLMDKETGVKLSGEMGWIRRDAAGHVQYASISNGDALQAGDLQVKLKKQVDYIEIGFTDGQPKILAGDAKDIQRIRLGRRTLSVR